MDQRAEKKTKMPDTLPQLSGGFSMNADRRNAAGRCFLLRLRHEPRHYLRTVDRHPLASLGVRARRHAKTPRLPNRSMPRPCPPSGAAPYVAHPSPGRLINSSIPAKKKPAAAKAEAGQCKGGNE